MSEWSNAWGLGPHGLTHDSADIWRWNAGYVPSKVRTLPPAFSRDGGMKKEAERYIEKQKTPQKEIIKKLRRIILKTFPKIKEEMKMGVPWYEGKYYIVGLKDHVNMGFCLGGMSKKDMGLLEGAGKTMRHLKFYSLRDIDEKKIVKLMKAVKK